MENFSKTKMQRLKIRRGVNLEPLLPPFMWQRSRPLQTPGKSTTDLLELEEKKMRDEIRVAAVQKFAPTSNILLDARRAEYSIGKSTVDLGGSDGEEIFNETSNTTKDSRDSRSTGVKEFTEASADPMVSHALSTPYENLPQPRYYRGDGTNSEYNPVQLAKRCRSPIRHVLPEKFDLEASRKKLPISAEKSSNVRPLETPNNRISDESNDHLQNTPYEHPPVSLAVIFKVILEELILVSAGQSLGLGVQAFVNVAATWALVALETAEIARTTERKFPESAAVPAIPTLCGQVAQSCNPLSSTARNPLLSIRGSIVHQSLPWDLLCPGHEAGIVDGYRNVADCIDDVIPGIRKDNEKAAHVSDLTCSHFHRVVTAGRHKKDQRVSPHRNFRRFRNAKFDTARIDELLGNLVGIL